MANEKTEEGTPRWVFALVVALFALVIGGIAAINLYPRYYGATAEDIASVALDQTPKALAKALPCTKTHETKVTTTFRHGALGFESATFVWDESADHVSGISLNAEREHEEPKTKKQEVSSGPRSLASKLDSFLPGVTSRGKREWGTIVFEASDHGDLSFGVTASSSDHRPNPLFARQVEAARQMLLAIAFDISPTLSKAELADLLGTGYALADIAKIDLATPEATLRSALGAQFPAAFVPAAYQDRVRVPVDHLLVSDVVFRWGAYHKHADVTFHGRLSFAERRTAFVQCLESKTRAPPFKGAYGDGFRFGPKDGPGLELDVKDDSLEAIAYAERDITTFPVMIATIDACR